MSETKYDDLAFASSNDGEWQDGLTKREYFSAVAMQGNIPVDVNASYEKIAIQSVAMADELIKQLNKGE